MAKKLDFYLGVLENMADILILVGTRSIILGFFDTVIYSEDSLSPSLNGIPLNASYGFWEKPTFPCFYVFWNASENGR